MTSLSIGVSMPDLTPSLRELGERLLKSCKRKPVDIQRWVRWRADRCDLSFEMIDNALLAGGKRELARALYLQKAAELIDPIATDIPPMDEVKRMAVEADCDSDRARNLALLDGEITQDEAHAIIETHSDEVKVFDMLIERLRRSRNYLKTRIG